MDRIRETLAKLACENAPVTCRQLFHLAVSAGQPAGCRPKSAGVYRDRDRPPMIYPDPAAVRPGGPLIVTEGAFDALLLGQILGDLAAVVMLGSAGARPDPGTAWRLLSAAPWSVALDADEAGDRSAAAWGAYPRARRVRPPMGKDWCEAHEGGVDLRRWWLETVPLERLLMRLQARGIRLDGTRVYPRIAVGTVTGRVTYIEPALQALPAADRLCRLGPVGAGRHFVRADYGQIEPRVLWTILCRHGRTAWDAGEDLYQTLAGGAVDRDAAKAAVNTVIDGGRPPKDRTGRLAEFVAAAAADRATLATGARVARFVRTLAGRPIPLAAEANFAGKAVNRVVPGTAADLFHRAAIGVAAALGARGLAGEVAFLLADELWVECDPGDHLAVAGLVAVEMATAALELGFPVRVDPAPGWPPTFTRDQLYRWRRGPAVADPGPDIEEE
jgi:hypothetical protein